MARWGAFLIAAVMVLVGPHAAEAADRRVALVIGVSHYVNVSVLSNTGNDATLITPVLRQLGFDTEMVIDPTYDAMKAAIRRFGDRIDGVSVALFYYAGHGLQVGGHNFLLPTTASIEKEGDLSFEAFDVQVILNQMDAPGRVNLVFLDACRENPFARTLATRLGTRGVLVGQGLAGVDSTAAGTLIAYATDPENVAVDGDGANSPFTAALARHLATPGLDVRQMLTRVRSDVLQATGRRQRPWVSDGLESDFFFNPTATSQQDVTQAVFAGLRAATRSASRSVPPPEAAGTTRDCPDCPDLVRIPAGSFTMGVPPEEEARETIPEGMKGRSLPLRTVQISQPFLLGRTHVTRRQYRAFVEATGHSAVGCTVWNGTNIEKSNDRTWDSPGFVQGDDEPVVCVSFEDALAYVVWLSAQTGQKYRLPSEAEWEYAARAGARTARYWGNSAADQCTYANGEDQSAKLHVKGAANWPVASCDDGYAYTSPVAHFRPNGFGLYDMLGNAVQFTADCWNPTFADAPTDGTPWGEGDCGYRVVRGGSWFTLPSGVRAGFRYAYPVDYRTANAGFRVARAVSP